MIDNFTKRALPDLGRKLSHLEGILGAYLPSYRFESRSLQDAIDGDRSKLSKLRSGSQQAANWELGRFIEHFELGKHELDYRLFLEDFDRFDETLRAAGVGSYGTTAALQLREALHERITPKAKIEIRKDRNLNVGGIGGEDEVAGITLLTARDRVSLSVPLAPTDQAGGYLMLLHDFPDMRTTSCLMPSKFAEEHTVSGQTLILPRPQSGAISFPVNGSPGYRCLYAIQSPINLADHIGLKAPHRGVVDIETHHIRSLLDVIKRVPTRANEAAHMAFGEYVLMAQ